MIEQKPLKEQKRGAIPEECGPVNIPDNSTEVFFVRISEIIIPDEFAQPMKIPLKFILNQYNQGTCDPVVLTPENVLVEGIKQLKVATLFGWKKIRAIIQNTEESL